jgi:hypothetical protein
MVYCVQIGVPKGSVIVRYNGVAGSQLFSYISLIRFIFCPVHTLKFNAELKSCVLYLQTFYV